MAVAAVAAVALLIVKQVSERNYMFLFRKRVRILGLRVCE